MDVVPYNPHLTRMFNCHINVEVCSSVQAVKYIHKYIYKGHDLTILVAGGAPDEILQYLNARYIGSPEGAWRLLGYRLHEEVPNVVRLAVHLPGKQRVVYDPEDTVEEIHDTADNTVTTLMAYFDYNRSVVFIHHSGPLALLIIFSAIYSFILFVTLSSSDPLKIIMYAFFVC